MRSETDLWLGNTVCVLPRSAHRCHPLSGAEAQVQLGYSSDEWAWIKIHPLAVKEEKWNVKCCLNDHLKSFLAKSLLQGDGFWFFLGVGEEARNTVFHFMLVYCEMLPWAVFTVTIFQDKDLISYYIQSNLFTGWWDLLLWNVKCLLSFVSL